LDRQTAQQTTRSLVRQLVSSGTRPHSLPALLRTYATHLWLQVGRTRWLRKKGCLPSTSRPCSTTHKPLPATGCRHDAGAAPRRLTSSCGGPGSGPATYHPAVITCSGHIGVDQAGTATKRAAVRSTGRPSSPVHCAARSKTRRSHPHPGAAAWAAAPCLVRRPWHPCRQRIRI